jgi:AcrR family transcriptional regulator
MDGNFGNVKSFHSFAARMELKDRIKYKADELYRRYGVKSVTMDEIATQMGISKKTIYHCFSDKNELVDAVVVGMLDGNRELCKMNRTQAKNAIHEAFIAMDSMQKMFDNMNTSLLFDIERGHPDSFKKFLEFKYNFLFEVIQNNMERGQAEGLYREELDVQVIAKTRLECMILPFNDNLFPKNEFPTVYVQQQLIEFFLYGMATHRGTRLIERYQKERLKKNVK